MPSAKRKKIKYNKKKKSPEKISEVRTVALSGDPRSQIIFKYIFSCLLFIYLLFYLLKLFLSLEETLFWADENVHAYVSSVISDTYSLPTLLPEDIYGGFKWSYPPLFHIMAAGIVSVASFAALKYINLVFLLLFFISFYFIILKYYGQNEAVIACLLISLSPAVAVNSIRFMTDMLSMVLLFFSAFFFMLSLEKENRFHPIISGLATGLLLLCKQTGIIVLSFYGLLFLWFLWKDKNRAKTMFYIIGVSMVIYTPYFIWGVYHKIDVSGFLYYFFGDMPEWAALAVKSFRRYDSSLKEFADLFYKGSGLVVTVSLLIPIYYLIESRAKALPYNCIFGLLIYLMLAMAIWHITNERHTLSLLPILTFLAGYAIPRIVRKTAYIQIAIFLLFLVSAYSVYKMPDYRQKYNGPEEYVELANIIKKDHTSAGRIFVLQAFDIFMYTRKPVIWPYPNLNNIPIDLVEKQTTSQLYKAFKKYQIDYILIDLRKSLNAGPYNGRSYPLHLIINCDQLYRRGDLQLLSVSNSKKFLLLKVPRTRD